MSPLVSIITPCLNRAAMIGEALESVRSQGCPEVEHLVVDGGSTDGTLEVLRQFPGVRIISEPDRGLYDAINKGVAHSRGDILGLLNSDDFYEPGALRAVMVAFEESPDVDSVAGRFVVFEDDGHGQRALRASVDAAEVPRLDLRSVLGVNPAINARFFRRQVFERCGPFDLHFSIAADRKFLIRAALANFRAVSLPGTLYHYRWHGGSLTMNAGSDSNRKAAAESLSIAEEILAADGMDAGARQKIAGYHAKVSVQEALTELYDRRPVGALRFAVRGIRVRPVWPGLFAGEFLRACAGRLGRLMRLL